MTFKLFLIIIVCLLLGVVIGVYSDILIKPYNIYPNHAPSNYINESQIHLYNNSVCIDVENPEMSRYAPTGSMTPSLSQDSNGIEISINNINDINLGDMITFTRYDCVDYGCTVDRANNTDRIIHRVIGMGYDNDGWYAITKGDYNVLNDGKIRKGQLLYKTIILVY